MSATSELLFEEVSKLEEELKIAKEKKLDTFSIEERLSFTKQRLLLANEGLNESKHILKG